MEGCEMSRKLRNEIVDVEVRSDRQVAFSVAHDPHASYSRSVRPFLNRAYGIALIAKSAEMYRRIQVGGWEIAAVEYDAPNLADGRAVTVYVGETTR